MKRIVIVLSAIMLCSIFLPHARGPWAEERKNQSPAQAAKPPQGDTQKPPAASLQPCDADEKSLELRRRREMQEQATQLRERRDVLSSSEKRLREDQRKLQQDIQNQRIDQQITRVEQEIQRLNERILELEQRKLQLTQTILQLQHRKLR